MKVCYLSEGLRPAHKNNKASVSSPKSPSTKQCSRANKGAENREITGLPGRQWERYFRHGTLSQVQGESAQCNRAIQWDAAWPWKEADKPGPRGVGTPVRGLDMTQQAMGGTMGSCSEEQQEESGVLVILPTTTFYDARLAFREMTSYAKNSVSGGG